MGIGMPKRDIKKIIRKWCEEEGIFGEVVEEPQTVFNYTINYPVELKHKINVIQPTSRNDKVIILSGTKFDPKTMEKMRGMSHEELEDLLWDIRIALCSRPTEFELVKQRDNGIPSALIITTQIYSDGLTKDRLMAAIRDVYKSKLLAVWKIHKRIEV
jgi:hypothetical protein